MKQFIIIVLVLALVGVALTFSTNLGKTTRYWDCCKESCSWSGKAKVTKPVYACERDGVTPTPGGADVANACGGGGLQGKAYMCNSHQPYAINGSLSFGFVSGVIEAENEAQWCCSCYELTFTGTAALEGKKMVVQVSTVMMIIMRERERK